MPQPDWESVEHALQELTERVARLEQHTGLHADTAISPAPAAIAEDHPLASLPNLLPVIGRALLALAGAYLLRALTESHVWPPEIGIACGTVYALFWLAWAVKRPLAERWNTAADSLTALLVFAPLLWEATARFQLLGTRAAAAILLVFAVFGITISGRKRLLVVSTFATLASLGTGAALLLATHDVLPFIYLFLAIAAALEISACFDLWLGERWLAAATADAAVLLATWLVTNEHGLPPDYAPIAREGLLLAQAALLVIYLSSTIFRTLLRGYSIRLFETVQCAAAFAICLSGGERMAPLTAGFMVVCGAACYVASFALLERSQAAGRNFYTYSTFAILLALAGSRILLSGESTARVWLVLAVASVWSGALSGRLTLQMHGCIYLSLALMASGAMGEAGYQLLGPASWTSKGRAALWAGLAAAAAAYGLVIRYSSRTGESGARSACRQWLASLFVWTGAGAAAVTLVAAYHLVFAAGAADAYCSTLRTAVLGCLALLLAWTGGRGKLPELANLVYPVMLLGGYRLLAHDLHQDDKMVLFLSLLLLGAVLSVLPKLKRIQPETKSISD